MKPSAIALASIVLLLASNPLALGANSPFPVGDRAQLFIDQVLVQDTRAVWFTAHPGKKHPGNPVLVADQPWEPWMVSCNTVIFDPEERIFKMWYSNYSIKRFESGWNDNYYFDNPTICYAVSEDGIHWRKPMVGTMQAENGKPHNAVAKMHPGSVFKDNRDSDPRRRYKMVGWSHERHGYHTLVSADGLKWDTWSQQPIAPHGDVITGYYDQRIQKYVAFPKSPVHVLGFKRRTFSTMLSDDFSVWSQPVLSFRNDLRDDARSLASIEPVRPLLDEPDDPAKIRQEFYGIGVYQAESCTLAFPWMLTTNARARYGNDQGLMEIQLAVSRDLLSWERPFRSSIVELGQLHEWDSVKISSPSEALQVGDEIWMYYTGGNNTHGVGEAKKKGFVKIPGHPPAPLRCSIGLAMWKLDRFVSADGPKEGGSLSTVPVTFVGERLEINARTNPGGRITVEILDGGGRPLKRWARSDPFSGDAIRHTVRFSGISDIAELEGKPVRLRFNLYDAQLFSFAFRPNVPGSLPRDGVTQQ
jgi:hypothetical protein